ncbi:MAG: TetR/AcrR family transcriptional regulator [Acidimicrobiia bacterium]
MRLPAPERRQQLLDVACEMFAERGFHSTSMDDIAATAGVTKPVLYQHFPSKRALYLELLDGIGADLLSAITAATDRATTGRERVEQGFHAYFRWVAGNRAAFRLLFGASVRNDAEFAEIADRVIEQVAEAVTTLIDIEGSSTHRTVLAHALVGIAEATSRRLSTEDAESDPEVLASWLAEMAWFGLRGVRAEEAALRDAR